MCGRRIPDHPRPELALSTHMDTVPPFIPSSETPDRIYGRGSCDAKGIIVAQIAAAEKLKAKGIHVGLLFLVGEERDSQGAQTANQRAARREVPDQRRAHGEPDGAGFKGNVARGGGREGKDGALGLSRAGRVGDREAARRAGENSQD